MLFYKNGHFITKMVIDRLRKKSFVSKIIITQTYGVCLLTLMRPILPLPPEPTRILKQPEYKVVQLGRSAVFECKVKHDPSLIPTMTWLKDDGELPDDERSEPPAEGSLLRPELGLHHDNGFDNC